MSVKERRSIIKTLSHSTLRATLVAVERQILFERRLKDGSAKLEERRTKYLHRSSWRPSELCRIEGLC
jgi:hypothetical protein